MIRVPSGAAPCAASGVACCSAPIGLVFTIETGPNSKIGPTWLMDDFYANYTFFTPAYVRQMQTKAKAINPRLAFLPLMYFPK